MVARGPVAADTKESHNFVPYAGIKLTANGQRCLEHQSSGVDHGLQGHLSRGSQRQHLGVEIGDSHLRTQATRSGVLHYLANVVDLRRRKAMMGRVQGSSQMHHDFQMLHTHTSGTKVLVWCGT